MEQQHSEQYMLELQLTNDTKKWYVFAQGISPLFYRFEGIRYFRIYKQWVFDSKWERKSLTGRFSQFQRVYRRHFQIKTLVRKHLRKLESGEVTFQQLLNRLK